VGVQCVLTQLFVADGEFIHRVWANGFPFFLAPYTCYRKRMAQSALENSSATIIQYRKENPLLSESVVVFCIHPANSPLGE
jgi:hypothetical protein